MKVLSKVLVFLKHVFGMADLTFNLFVADKKEEVKEVKAEKKKKSDSGVDEPPVKKSKSSDDGKDYLTRVIQKLFVKSNVEIVISFLCSN